MTIGIIGSGGLGSRLAALFAKNGIETLISNSRGPDSLAGLVQKLGPNIKAVTPADAAKADIVVIAVQWRHLEKGALNDLGDWTGRIVVDGTNALEVIDPNSPDAKDSSNPLAAFGIRAIDVLGRYSSEAFRSFVPGATVVKAFNHLIVELLEHPEAAGGKRVLFYAGDEAAAKGQIHRIIEQIGFSPIDLGSLDVGGPLINLPFGPLAGHNLIRI